MYLLIAIAILWLLSSVLGKVQHTLIRTVRHKEGLPEPAPMTRKESTIFWLRNNKKLVAVILIFLTLYGSVKVGIL